MAKKRPEPIITHTEIYALAIRTIDSDINVWRQRCEGLPENHFASATEQLFAKREALKELYRIETGVNYD